MSVGWLAVMHTAPFVPRATRAWVATIRSGEALLFDVGGSGVPQAKTFTHSTSEALTAVTFRLTAVTVAGTPYWPPIDPWRTVPGPTVGGASRVSRARTGVTAW